MNKTAIIYVRKSNEDKGKNAIRAQLERCRKYAQQLGAEIVAELIDENVKGTVPISERPEGSKIAQIHADMVIMRDGTRLVRPKNKRKLSVALLPVEWIHTQGKALHFSDSGEVPADEMGALLALIQGIQSAAEYERIRERSKEARREHARRGRWPVGLTPYGITKLQNGDLVLDEQQVEIIKLMSQRYLYEGDGLWSLSQWLNDQGILGANGGKWYAGTLRRLLSSRHLVGELTFTDILINRPDLRILSDDVFYAVQIKMKQNRYKGKGATKREFLLAGRRLKCKCGRTMTATVNGIGNKYYYYNCNARKNNGECDMPMLPAHKVDAIVWQRLTEFFTSDELEVWLVDIAHEDDARAARLECDLASIDGQIAENEKHLGALIAAFGHERDKVIHDRVEDEIRQTSRKLGRLKLERDSILFTMNNNDTTAQRAVKLANQVRQFMQGDEVDIKTKQKIVKILDCSVHIEMGTKENEYFLAYR